MTNYSDNVMMTSCAKSWGFCGMDELFSWFGLQSEVEKLPVDTLRISPQQFLFSCVVWTTGRVRITISLQIIFTKCMVMAIIRDVGLSYVAKHTLGSYRITGGSHAE